MRMTLRPVVAIVIGALIAGLGGLGGCVKSSLGTVADGDAALTDLATEVAGDATSDGAPADIGSDGQPDVVVSMLGTMEGYATLSGQAQHESILIQLTGTAGVPLETTTDVTGFFRFADLPPGAYSVEGSRPGYTTASSAPFSVVAGETYIVAELILAPTSGNLEGYVIVDGEPTDAGVLVAVEGTTRSTTSAPDGYWSIANVPIGNYAVTASFTGFGNVTTSDVQVDAGQLSTVPTMTLFKPTGVAQLLLISGDAQTGLAGITLPEPLVVEVRDATGAVAANQQVLFELDTASDGMVGLGLGVMQTVSTDSVGKASVTAINGFAVDLDVKASIAGLEVAFHANRVIPARVRITAGNGQSALVGATLPDAIVGVVELADGTPVVGLAVPVILQAGLDSGQATPETLVSDDQGNISFQWQMDNTDGAAEMGIYLDVDVAMDAPLLVAVDDEGTPLLGEVVHATALAAACELVAATIIPVGAPVGTSAADLVVVLAQDSSPGKNPLDGIEVKFEWIAAGGAGIPSDYVDGVGVIGTSTVITGADGTASTSVQPGQVGQMALRAVAAGCAGAPWITVTGQATQLDMLLEPGGTVSEVVGAEFEWSATITSNAVPVEGVLVEFEPTQLGGLINDGAAPQSALTNALGKAIVTAKVGTQTHSGGTALVYSYAARLPQTATEEALMVTPTPDVPASIELAAWGPADPKPCAQVDAFSVVVKDEHGNVVPGASVSFSVMGGSFTGAASATTDATGEAAVPAFVVLCSAATGSVVTVTATVAGPLPQDFDITVAAPLTPDIQAAPASVTYGEVSLITIGGTEFEPWITATVNGAPASVNWVNSSSLQISHTAVDCTPLTIAVANSETAGGASPMSAVVPVEAITSVEARSVWPGYQMEIVGPGIDDATAVWFDGDGVGAAPLSPIAGTIEAVAPALPVGSAYLDTSVWVTLPTGPACPAYPFSVRHLIPDTGYDQNYAGLGPNQDGHPDQNHPVRQKDYTNNLDGTFTDNLTGLTWESSSFPANGNTAPGLCTGGWRLPSVSELVTLLELSEAGAMMTDGSLAIPLPTETPGIYWASEVGASTRWTIDLDTNGASSLRHVALSARILCVSGPPPALDLASVEIGGELVVDDLRTGLRWQSCLGGASGLTCTGAYASVWEEANIYCDQLELAERDDWRLPDRHELASIIDHAAGDLIMAGAGGVWADAVNLDLWSGSAHTSDSVWSADLTAAGSLFPKKPSGTTWFRCVTEL